MSAELHASKWARIVLVELELELSPGARHLVDALAHYANEQGTVWPTVDTLMTRMGRSRRFVEQARAELVKLRLLLPVSGQTGGRRADGAGVRARYRLALPESTTPHRRAGFTAPEISTTPHVTTKNPAPPCGDKTHRRPTVNTSTDAVPRGAAHDGAEFPMTITVDPVPDGATWDDYYAPVGMNGGSWDVR